MYTYFERYEIKHTDGIAEGLGAGDATETMLYSYTVELLTIHAMMLLMIYSSAVMLLK